MRLVSDGETFLPMETPFTGGGGRTGTAAGDAPTQTLDWSEDTHRALACSVLSSLEANYTHLPALEEPEDNVERA